ncbi:hypothetical protein lerEdw1_004676 [Lerista edwardsae]|nr:hypothetical protein lerEdw1_004676 [Lerista edwardsae]
MASRSPDCSAPEICVSREEICAGSSVEELGVELWPLGVEGRHLHDIQRGPVPSEPGWRTSGALAASAGSVGPTCVSPGAVVVAQKRLMACVDPVLWKGSLMATLLALSALLSTLLPSSVAVGWTGCQVPSAYLERLGPSSVRYWTDSMQHVAEGADFSSLPGGLVSCRAGLMTCASVKLALVPAVGLNVNVVLDTLVRCKLLLVDVELRVSVGVQVRLLVRDVLLAVDSCAVVDLKVVVSPLLRQVPQSVAFCGGTQ